MSVQTENISSRRSIQESPSFPHVITQIRKRRTLSESEKSGKTCVNNRQLIFVALFFIKNVLTNKESNAFEHM